MTKDIYFYTHKSFAEYIKNECNEMKKVHGIKLSTADMSNLLIKKVIEPNKIKITDTIKPIDVNLKWKRLRLKL